VLVARWCLVIHCANISRAAPEHKGVNYNASQFNPSLNGHAKQLLQTRCRMLYLLNMIPPNRGHELMIMILARPRRSLQCVLIIPNTREFACDLSTTCPNGMPRASGEDDQQLRNLPQVPAWYLRVPGCSACSDSSRHACQRAAC
jgi:hypothetical protein